WALRAYGRTRVPRSAPITRSWLCLSIIYTRISEAKRLIQKRIWLKISSALSLQRPKLNLRHGKALPVVGQKRQAVGDGDSGDRDVGEQKCQAWLEYPF